LAVDPDFGSLVLVLAATDCRFSQAALLRVRDLQFEARRILVPPSRKGRSTKARAQIAVPVGDDVIDRLRGLVIGRAGQEPLLQRWISRQTGPFTWERVRRAHWTSASEMTRNWARALARTDVLAETPPYALRHSSIVRALRAGVPVRITAALHDTSSAMIEKHYAAFILDISDDLARRAVTSLVTAPAVRLSIAV
jgi:integrase